ncbi:hypothetical protein DID88_008587 [Monilinia fructigena]|uniref:Myb-like domain-containing protein n=1 Tax=Monilinia fructigena TaxID=38457 RepID=A0A395J693_9HELO|nr:hypothetical protein DID88_008587 [Monilinia fructigena]
MLVIYSASIQSPTFFKDSIPITSPTISRNLFYLISKMTTMGEPSFGGGHSVPHSAGHSSARTPDVPWTPYSAVSSFNLPAHYDSSLITPITMAPSPHIPSRPAPTVRDRDKQPSSHSAKAPTSEPNYPTSPALFCPSPYYGAFGVSATPKSGRSAELASPNMNNSPQDTASSAIGNDLHRSRHPTPAQSPGNYRVNNTAPILIAPNPNTMRPATRPGEIPYRDGVPYGRHDSMHSMHSISTSIDSYSSTPQQQCPVQQLEPLPSRRKRKTPPVQLDGNLVYSGEVNEEEQILMELSQMEGVPWKEIAKQFNAATGKTMKIPALQMRKKRLCERLRVWTDCEERALTLAWEDYDKAKWEEIAKGMLNHGVQEKWSKEAVQRKFNELFHSDDRSYESEYASSRHTEHIHFNVKMEPRTPWPSHDERDGALRNLTDDDVTLVGDLRSRTASDASSVHFQQQQQQQQHQQMMYAQQHQQHQQHQQNHQEVGRKLPNKPMGVKRGISARFYAMLSCIILCTWYTETRGHIGNMVLTDLCRFKIAVWGCYIG